MPPKMARLLRAATRATSTTTARARLQFQHHHARAIGTAASQGRGLEPDVLSEYPGLDASKLTIARNKNPKQLLRKEDLVFGRDFTGESSSALTGPLLCTNRRG